MADNLTIEQTNELRKKLGLAPLDIGTSDRSDIDNGGNAQPGISADDEEARAVENLRALRAEEARVKNKKKLAENIERNRSKARLNEKLVGKGLGDADEEDDALDAKNWVKRSKAKALTRVQKKEIEVEQQPEYKTNHLAGLKVGHDLNDIAVGDDVVLTLKDSNILDEENDEHGGEDELVNVQLTEHERLQNNLSNKKKRPVYKAFEEDEDGQPVGVLSKYDEEIDGGKKKKNGFILDGSTGTNGYKKSRLAMMDDEDIVSTQIAPKVISLEKVEKARVESDYQEVKIRKPKRKPSERQNRSRAVEYEDEAPLTPSLTTEPDTASIPVSTTLKPNTDHLSFVDDEELQAALTKQRREAARKRRLMQQEEEAEAELNPPQVSLLPFEEMEPTDGLVFDDTSEFVRGLSAPKKEARAPSTAISLDAMQVDDAVEEEDDEMSSVEDEDKTPETLPAPPITTKKATKEDGLGDSTGMGDEELWEGGLGKALGLLRQKGFVKASTEEDRKRSENQVQREKWLIEEQKRNIRLEAEKLAQREEDRRTGKFDRMSQREREAYAQRQNQIRDHDYAREQQKRFKDYKPDVNIKYIDEYGRAQTPKEVTLNR